MEVGKRCICVDDSVKPEFIKDKNILFQVWVKKDAIYTIREILTNDGIVVGVLLNEIRNNKIYQPLLKRYQEPCYATFRFRELEDNKVMSKEEVEELCGIN